MRHGAAHGLHATSRGRPAVFLDKDGTLIRDVPYNVDPELIALMPGAGAALRALQDAGFMLIVVSNQSGVARGMFREEALDEVLARLRELLAPAGVELDGWYHCPHHPEGTVQRFARRCSCRKPEPGMIERAAREHGVDVARSWMIGDILNDVEAGNRAGCRSLLVDTGGETEWLRGPGRAPWCVVRDLPAAAELIVRDARASTVPAGDLVGEPAARRLRARMAAGHQT